MTIRIEPILKLLTFLLLFFTGVLLFVAKYMNSDGQTFQVISGLLMGVAGALLGWIKPPSTGSSIDPPPGTSRAVTTVEVSKGPAQPVLTPEVELPGREKKIDPSSL